MKQKFLILMIALVACSPSAPTASPTATMLTSPTATTRRVVSSSTATIAPLSPAPTPINSVRFAVIGDYGLAGEHLDAVAKLVKNWQPDIILTVGDNNYPEGEAATIDENIGAYFHEFIFPYTGVYGEGAQENRFFPALGNHDWNTLGAQPYLDYFPLPGNERYYDFVWGPVHFFAIDSDSR